MKKWIIIKGDNKFEVNYEYNIGEIITTDSIHKIKCVKKEVVNGELIQYFVGTRMVWDEWEDIS